MSNIYITKYDIDYKIDGCGCCFYEKSAKIEDVKKLITELENQKYTLSLLAEMMEDYSREEIIRWFGIYEQIRSEKSAVEAGEKYAVDKSIQGPFYFDSFKKLDEHKANLVRLEKEYKRIPSVFKKYIKETER